MAEPVKRDKLVTRWGQLKTERATWYPHWKDLSSIFLPRNGRFFIQDRNRGQRRDNAIYDNTGTRAVRVLSAGMMSGMTSPARPWFRLGLEDTDLALSGPVKLWLSQATGLMREVFARSNTYRALHSLYEELAVFGTAANIILDDFDDIVHHHPLTCGEYAIATNFRGEVDTLYREFQITIKQMVAEFGIDNVSTSVKNLFDRGSLDQWVTVIHCIEPRVDREPKARDAKNMPWKSVYFEIAADPDHYLRESGFERFPVLAPRWAVAGGDIYGNSPGMEALGDTRQLQQQQLRKSQGIDYMTNPPLQVPTSARAKDIDSLPGGLAFVDSATPGGGIRTQFDVRLDLNHLLADIQDVRQRVNGAFYADLFMMLANQTDARMTATEVAERHEEKLLMLGPVLERLQNELLDPLIDMTFERMLKAGVFPPPPEELKDKDIQVEYVSMLAQAQKAVGTNSIDRFVGSMGALSQYKPDVLDKLDADYWADTYGDLLGVDPKLIRDENQVAGIRDARAQAAKEQAAQEQAAQQAQTVKNLGQADPNQLRDVIGMFSGYTTPQQTQTGV